MAFFFAFSAPVVAVGVVAAVAASDWDEDPETRKRRKERRSQQLAEHPLNTRTVVIRQTGHLGVTLQDMHRERVLGVRVKSVVPGDLADQAGLRANDWIVKVNGTVVETHTEAMALLTFAASNGVPLQLEVMSPRTIAIDVSAAQHLGVTLRNEPLRRGVLLAALDPADFLARHGFCTGDVLTEIDGHRAKDHDETLRRLSRKRASKPRVLQVTVMTSGAEGLKQLEQLDVKQDIPVVRAVAVTSAADDDDVILAV